VTGITLVCSKKTFVYVIHAPITASLQDRCNIAGTVTVHVLQALQHPLTQQEPNMNTRTIFLSGALAITLAMAGCATNSPSNAQIGTGVGAVAGGLLGDAVFGSTLGTVGGAAAGALIGNEVGKKSDQPHRGKKRH
jgi:osmotically inducible lipoprotein OsmB